MNNTIMYCLLMFLSLFVSDVKKTDIGITFSSTCQVHVKGSQENWTFDEVYILVDEDTNQIYVLEKAYKIKEYKTTAKAIYFTMTNGDEFIFTEKSVTYIRCGDPDDRILYKDICYRS